MRRSFAVAALAAGMLAAAACGNNDNDGGDGQSNEAICARLNEQIPPLEAELNTGISEVGAAAAQGDQAAAAEAAIGLSATVDQITGAARDGAADAEDEQLSTALESFATELENLAGAAASGQPPDLTAFEAARADVEQICGEF